MACAPPDLTDSLCDPRLADQLTRLGLRGEDLPTVLGWARAVAKRPNDLARVAELISRLRAGLGQPERSGEVFEPVDRQHELGRGVLPLLALALAAPAVREYQAARGIEAEVSDDTLADLGQKVVKDRQVNGSTGLHNQAWLARIWAGRFVRLGRLQYELTASDCGILAEPVPVLSVHIDESGPLHPDEVDESLLRASTYVEEHFPEVGPIDWFICESWLLDPGLAHRMPGSNLADFTRRFTVWKAEEDDRDGLYFGFGIEPAPGASLPGDLDRLPADTALRRAMLELWREGEHVMGCSGRLPVISELTT
ncbi:MULTISPECIES: acyltransferase domain-containing protein [unclassified Luteococcus]|uniref:acyltransferase domain-containing protein n=1 Tax=unclassified Luteococcus TaxID=2639923 RepID=UPI00313DD2C7